MPKQDLASASPSPETLQFILETIGRLAEPKTAAQISKLLDAPHQTPEKGLIPVLEEFASNGRLHVFAPATTKGKPRYWDRDLATVVRRAVDAARPTMSEPLTAKQITSQIAGTIKCSEADLTPILDEFVAAHSLFAIPAKTAKGKPRYWSRTLDDLIGLTVLQLVNAKGPQAGAALQKGVKGVAASRFDETLQKLIDQKHVFPHPGVGKKKAVVLFGRQPARPEPYLTEIQSALADVVTRLKAAHVPPDNLRRAIVQMIEAAGVTFGGSASNGQSEAYRKAGETSIDLIALMREVEPAADRGALVPPAKLRRAAKLPKLEFDQTILQLALQGRISLHRHDFVASLSEAEQADLVTDGMGSYYVGLALRPKIDV